MKKILSIIFSLLLLTSYAGFAGADNGFIADDHGYLHEIAALNDLAAEAAEKTGYTISCILTDSEGGMDGNEQAQRVFEEKFGSREGILLLDCIDTQRCYIYFSPEIYSQLTEKDAGDLFEAYSSPSDKDSSVRFFVNKAKEILLSSLSEKESPESSPLPENKVFARVVDLASVISPSELEKLNTKADSISEQYQCDVAVIFAESTAPKDTQAYADDFYDSNDYGYGENDDGILLLIAVKDRRYAISTYGYGIEAFSDYDLDTIIGKIRSYLSAGNWSAAADGFITECGEVLYRRAHEPQYENTPYQQNAAVAEPISPITLIAINIAVGLLIASAIVASMKRKYTSVRKQTQAFNYLRDGSFKLTHSNDRFLNSQLSRVRKPQPQNRSSGGYHGGGTTHISSSGRPHGGKSGGF